MASAVNCKYWRQGRGCSRGNKCSFRHDPCWRQENVCRHWEGGFGCRRADTCNFIHNPDLWEKNVCHRWLRGRCRGDDCPRLHEASDSAWNTTRHRRTPSRSPSMSLPGSPVSCSDGGLGCARSRSRTPELAAPKRMPRTSQPVSPSLGSQLPPTNSSSGREGKTAKLMIEMFKDQGLDAARLTPEKLKDVWRPMMKQLHPDKWTLCPEFAREMNQVAMWMNSEKDKYAQRPWRK